MDSQRSFAPATMADLHLPPTVVVEHAIRTLSYVGAMNASELARHWRVRDSVAVEIVASLKAAGLIGLDSGQSNFERTGRVHLLAAGLDRVESARQRTRYAGPLPVALSDFVRLSEIEDALPIERTNLEAALAAAAIAPESAAEIGQAIAGDATLAIAGLTFDEQASIAEVLSSTLTGEITLPYALYAAGSVVRVFDRRYHRSRDEQSEATIGDREVLRAHEEFFQWASVEPPTVTFTGGVQESDILPAYDEESKFYVAPAPFSACGGMMIVFDAASNAAALTQLARLWLIPGRTHTGLILLRSGERIEVPWRASTVLFGDVAHALPTVLRDAVSYSVDVSELRDGALRTFIINRLGEADVFDADAISTLTGLLGRRNISTRIAAAMATRYLLDRAAYERASFVVTPAVLARAVDFADGHRANAPAMLRVAS